MAQYEFLPLCDVLFNIISLAAYFCDIVFDVVMGYALYSHGRYAPFVLTMLFVGASATVEQTMSLRWYLAARAVGDKSSLSDRLKRLAVQALHFVQLGVLWRCVPVIFVPMHPPPTVYLTSAVCLVSGTSSCSCPSTCGTSSSRCATYVCCACCTRSVSRCRCSCCNPTCCGQTAATANTCVTSTRSPSRCPLSACAGLWRRLARMCVCRTSTG